jgi:hypothetical protein
MYGLVLGFFRVRNGIAFDQPRRAGETRIIDD